MTIARKVSPEAAIFVHFTTTVIRENWTVDGVRMAEPARAFLQEVAAAFEKLERLQTHAAPQRRPTIKRQLTTPAAGKAPP